MSDERHSRQTFLGPGSEQVLAGCALGIVGLGGGGSHIAQQAVHVGVRDFVLHDADTVEDSNLNRLVGGTAADALLDVPKVHALERLIVGVAPGAHVEAVPARWQDSPEALRRCDVVIGCVDSFAQRHELEVFARRYLIPYIDIGLDVVAVAGEPPQMGGQVFVSMPGAPCLWCAGFLTDERLAKEADRYGDAGHRPQVVWANGVLASSAVGIVVDLLTDWTRSLRSSIYLSYDANVGTVSPHPRAPYLPSECEHYPPDEVGTPRIEKI